MKSFLTTVIIIGGFLLPGVLSKANAQSTQTVYLSGTPEGSDYKSF